MDRYPPLAAMPFGVATPQELPEDIEARKRAYALAAQGASNAYSGFDDAARSATLAAQAPYFGAEYNPRPVLQQAARGAMPLSLLRLLLASHPGNREVSPGFWEQRT